MIEKENIVYYDKTIDIILCNMHFMPNMIFKCNKKKSKIM